MPEKTWTPTDEKAADQPKEPDVGTEEWAKLHRAQIQERVKARAQNATNLMREIEKIRPTGDGPEGRRAGRIPKIDPKTGKPYAHVILGFGSWSDFVREKQPEGLGWSTDHERVMWLGWRKAQAAGITPEMIDELGQAWLAEVGGNKKNAGATLSLESAQARIDEKRELARGGQKKKKNGDAQASAAPTASTGEKSAEPTKAEVKPPEGPAEHKPPTSTELAKRPKEAPLTTGKTPKAVLNAFLEQVAPTIEPKAALQVVQLVLPHLEPGDTALIAEEIVPKLESDAIGGILGKMVPMLDEQELWDVTRAAVRRLGAADLKKLGDDVGELLKARASRAEIVEESPKPKPEEPKAAEPDSEDQDEKPEKKGKKSDKKPASKKK